MLRALLCSLSILGPFVGSAGAQAVVPVTAVKPEARDWAALADFVDQYWLQSSSKPNQYIRFVWEVENLKLAFAGLDVDGNAIAGRFTRDPSNGQIAMASVRNGQLGTYAIELTATGFVLTGSDNGARVRQTYTRQAPGTYKIQFDEMRNGKWVAVRSMSFMAVTKDMVEALMWTPRNPQHEAEAAAARAALFAEQRPFLDRILEAIQAGVLRGTEAGVGGAVEDAINPG